MWFNSFMYDLPGYFRRADCLAWWCDVISGGSGSTFSDKLMRALMGVLGISFIVKSCGIAILHLICLHRPCAFKYTYRRWRHCLVAMSETDQTIGTSLSSSGDLTWSLLNKLCFLLLLRLLWPYLMDKQCGVASHLVVPPWPCCCGTQPLNLKLGRFCFYCQNDLSRSAQLLFCCVAAARRWILQFWIDLRQGVTTHVGFSLCFWPFLFSFALEGHFCPFFWSLR